MSLPTEQGKQIIQQHLDAKFFTPEEQQIIELVISLDQCHLFANWPAVGTQYEEKKKFVKKSASEYNLKKCSKI